jgi:AraC-like DNA-binding protein/mannose-6-phosphate isomerase-like protein (cupin superfamily)
MQMRWSLSEFLDLVEVRSRTWCFVALDSASGFAVPHSEEICFYAVLEGEANIEGVTGGALKLRAGDIAMILSGEAHSCRSHRKSTPGILEFLTPGDYTDAPPTLEFGRGVPATRLLAGKLTVRWPGGQHPRSIPPVLMTRSGAHIVDFQMLLQKALGSGGTAMLTRAATLLFISALRDHPQCQSAYQEFDLYNPVLRAQQHMQMHPFQRWTVEILARKVAMGRSNFATRFVRELGRTPMVLLAEERMKHAALFLEKTDMKITQVGRRVGYRSESAFIRRFTMFYGVRPGELRKRSRSANHPSSLEPSHMLPRTHFDSPRLFAIRTHDIETNSHELIGISSDGRPSQFGGESN